MASMPAARPMVEHAPSPEREGDVRPRSVPPAKTRAQRFEEAHEWVLEHHARTFEKLAK